MRENLKKNEKKGGPGFQRKPGATLHPRYSLIRLWRTAGFRIATAEKQNQTDKLKQAYSQTFSEIMNRMERKTFFRYTTQFMIRISRSKIQILNRKKFRRQLQRVFMIINGKDGENLPVVQECDILK